MASKLIRLFSETRSKSEEICSYLETEDYVVQPIADVSPPKWHLAHTSWFFEEFILKKKLKNYKEFHPDFSFIFNSYYQSIGERVLRANRGNLSRPTVSEVYAYRKYVTDAMMAFLKTDFSAELENIILTGVHHEKQHQELLITDIKYIFGNNPLFPKYNTSFEENPVQKFNREWQEIPSGVYEIGFQDKEGFSYDNELGAHKVYIGDFFISNKLSTNAEFLEFIEAGGYENVLLWHDEGWAWKTANNIKAPGYWYKIKGKWFQYTLTGLEELNLHAPVSHISYYEAFAFAQWTKMRLPTEFEWEVAQKHFKWGSRWEWTESAYLPYPGYKKAGGALGEYNGKFMVNQKVLRGSSVATSPEHSSPTYRNFFQPEKRWQFTGIRLAK